MNERIAQRLAELGGQRAIAKKRWRGSWACRVRRSQNGNGWSHRPKWRTLLRLRDYMG